jgi:esterase
MKFACENPNFVEKLIVVDMAPVQYPPTSYISINQILTFLNSLDIKNLKSRKDADTQASAIIKVPFLHIAEFLL